MERGRAFAEKYNISKLDYAIVDNSFAGTVWNSTSELRRRIVWRCNKRYIKKGKKGCNNKHIDDKVLYQAFIDTFNAMIENKDYFMEKWKEHLKSDNVLVIYKAKQFMGILKNANP